MPYNSEMMPICSHCTNTYSGTVLTSTYVIVTTIALGDGIGTLNVEVSCAEFGIWKDNKSPRTALFRSFLDSTFM